MPGHDTVFDIIIIGGGPAGYPLALSLARQRSRVALIEKSPAPGGVCLHNGCIPSKTIISAAELMEEVEFSNAYLRGVENLSVDWSALQNHKDQVIKQLADGVSLLLKQAGVEVIHGKASLRADRSVAVLTEKEELSLTAETVVIATGSISSIPSDWVEKPGLITSEELVHSDSVPESLAIIGGGVIGCEQGFAFSKLGSTVSIVEMQDRLLPEFEVEQSDLLGRVFSEKGIILHLGSQVTDWSENGGQAELSLASGETLRAEKVLVAIGRQGNTSDLNLESMGIEPAENSFISTDDSYQTNVAGFYAIGDVNGRSMFAHAATAQAHWLSEFLIGQTPPPPVHVPKCVYTIPEIASIGVQEAAAQSDDMYVTTGRFPYEYLGRALAGNHKEGLFKTIHERETGALIGLHISGQHATELIHAGMPLLHSRTPLREVMNYIWAHPTLAEGIGEAMRGSANLSHNLPVKKSTGILGNVLPEGKV